MSRLNQGGYYSYSPHQKLIPQGSTVIHTFLLHVVCKSVDRDQRTPDHWQFQPSPSSRPLAQTTQLRGHVEGHFALNGAHTVAHCVAEGACQQQDGRGRGKWKGGRNITHTQSLLAPKLKNCLKFFNLPNSIYNLYVTTLIEIKDYNLIRMVSL